MTFKCIQTLRNIQLLDFLSEQYLIPWRLLAINGTRNINVISVWLNCRSRCYGAVAMATSTGNALSPAALFLNPSEFARLKWVFPRRWKKPSNSGNWKTTRKSTRPPRSSSTEFFHRWIRWIHLCSPSIIASNDSIKPFFFFSLCHAAISANFRCSSFVSLSSSSSSSSSSLFTPPWWPRSLFLWLVTNCFHWLNHGTISDDCPSLWLSYQFLKLDDKMSRLIDVDVTQLCYFQGEIARWNIGIFALFIQEHDMENYLENHSGNICWFQWKIIAENDAWSVLKYRPQNPPQLLMICDPIPSF